MRARGSTTALGEKVWEAICHEIKGSKSQLPFLRHGLLKLAMTGMHLSATDCKRVFSNSSMVGKAVKADGLMSQLRTLATQASHGALADQKLVNVLGVVDSNMVAHVMNMQVADEKKYRSLEGICHDAVSIVARVLGVPIASPWEAHAEALPAAESGGKAADRLVELNPDGSMKQPGEILEAMSIKPGTFVRRKKNKVECEVLHVHDAVKLKNLSDGRAVRVQIDAFVRGEWQVYTPKQEVHEIMDLQPYGPQSVHPDFDIAHTVAKIHCEMHAVVQNLDVHATMEKVKLQLRPTKTLVTKSAIGKGKLSLVPFSSKVVVRSKSDTLQGAAEVTLKKGCHDRRFFIVASNIMPKASEDAPDVLVGFLSPFFFVQTVDEESKANMTIVLSGTNSSEIRIPIMKNLVPLPAGQELLIFKAKAPKQEEPLEAASPERRVKGKRAA